ncbi:MAG: alpha/beta hydrolase [Erysipelotrichaceae bacterium]|nr:alpha/beta hydrolase [Erysipelotrichaceae bacterium]
MYKEWNVTIPALTGDEERMACVYVPDSYLEDKNRRYPVLYMFDAHNLVDDSKTTFGNSWRILEYMTKEDIPLIIAAVDCNRKTEGEPYGGRLSEYAPFDYVQPQLGGIKGRGDITMDYFINVFKRYIDENYPTMPDKEHTFLAGSSMGGLMTVWALLEYNDVFSRAAALSPAFTFMPQQIKEYVEDWSGGSGILYMDAGVLEPPTLFSADLYSDITALLMKKGILLTSRLVPNGIHSEKCWRKQLPLMMNTLLYDLE